MTSTFKAKEESEAEAEADKKKTLILEDYLLTTFGSGVAKRIVEDVQEVRSRAVDAGTWIGLSQGERQQLVDCALIPAEAVLKYDWPEHKGGPLSLIHI